MGRHRRNWNAKCFLTPVGVLCGATHVSASLLTEHKADVTCRECRARLDEKEVKASTCVEFGETIRDKAWLGYSYRSIWPLKHQGVVVGFATLELGWGKPWMIREVREDGSMGDMVGERYARSSQYDSRFAALLAVPRLVAEGKLYAIEDAEAAVTKRREADRLEKEEKDRKAAIALKERNDRMAALASIASLPLNNAQRDALAHAYKAVYYATLPMPKVEA